MDKKIILVDDHHLVLDGLKTMLENQSGYRVVAALSDGEKVLDYLRSFEIDLVITDLEMPKMKGLELAEKIREKYDCKILVLSMHDEKSMLEAAMKLGVDGYILKDADKQDFLFAIQSILDGKRYFHPALLEVANNPSPKTASVNALLTRREIEVLKLLAEGLSNKEVGEKLFIAPKTVDTHRTNLMRKIEVNNVVGLVRYAFENELIDT